ncbi:hypothetical protein BSKO_01132 [Bryopsis sp. KO-2023]|nr:hypothetical protein BSKO_01132 [Bryopsis sp. KO-2023]
MSTIALASGRFTTVMETFIAHDDAELLFEIEVEGKSLGGSQQRREARGLSEAYKLALRDWTAPVDSFCEHLLRDIQLLKSTMAINDRRSTAGRHILAQGLANMGYDVKMRTAIARGNPVQMFSELAHKFITVKPAKGMQEVIVEFDFKAEFMILEPTMRYQSLLEDLPSEFVGTRERLTELVQFLCREMGTAFLETGRTVPPWRRHNSVVSKWRPRVFEDHAVIPTARAA